MKTQAIRLLATAALFLAAVAPAAAQELKIGYVNSERVLREAAPAKASQVTVVPRAAGALTTPNSDPSAPRKS